MQDGALFTISPMSTSSTVAHTQPPSTCLGLPDAAKKQLSGALFRTKNSAGVAEVR